VTARLAVLSDVHGNATALEAVRKALKKEKPDAVIVAGDLVMNGPEPSAAIDALRAMESDGATIVQGNTDVAVADFDYAAAFPWFTDGVPDAHRAAAEWAHDELGDERLGWLRRLPHNHDIPGIDVTLAGDGREAMELLRCDLPDIVLTDLDMPVMDGLTAISEIRRLEALDGLEPTLTFVLTANALPEHVRAAGEAGADGHISKPIVAGALLETLAQAIEAQRASAASVANSPPRARA